MLFRSARLSRRALVISVAAGALTISAAGAATFHSFAVTTTTGSEGATTFLQSGATSSALQGEVASSPQTALKIPFGVLGEYNAAGSTFGIGVAGVSTTGYAVAGESFSSQAAVLGLSSLSGPAVEADLQSSSTAPYAVYGNGANGGNGGYFSSAGGTALDSEVSDAGSDSGQGLYTSNQSTEASAVAANNYQASPPPTIDAGGGVYTTAEGPGVFAESKDDPGIATQFDCNAYSDSKGGDGGLGNTTCAGVYVINSGTKGWPFLYYNSTNQYYPFYVTSDGDATFAGTVTTSGDVVSRNPNTDEMTYTSKQTEKTVEDFGTAQLQNGYANVPLRGDFAATINTHQSYMVFLTPHGDNRGLFIAMTTPAGFTVRESQSGRSTLAFDYRIVAHPAGAVAVRLPHYHANLRAMPRADRATRRIAFRNGSKSNRHAQMRKAPAVPASLFKLNLTR